MKVFDRIRERFKSKDGRPVTITGILGRDDCSRLLSRFSDNNLSSCESLVIVWRGAGGLHVETSQNLGAVEAVGLLTIASGLVAGGSDAK